MQLLAAVLGTRIGVIWPAADDPLVVEALRIERRRTATEREGARYDSDAVSDADEMAADEIRVRRLHRVREGEPAAGDGDRPSSEPAPFVESVRAAGDADACDREGSSEQAVPDDLPPWPDEVAEELSNEDPHLIAGGVDREVEADCDRPPLGEQVPHGGGEEAATLRAARPVAGRRVKRAVVAVGVALLAGGAGMAAASALGERSGDADRQASAAAAGTVERARVAARARDVAAMRAAAERGDYDAAIRRAQQLEDTAAMSSYRGAAARVLVGRADKAARRGDLSLARSRLRAAKSRYGIAPGATAVRRIERQRKERAQRERAAARAAAAQLAAANAERTNASAASSAATSSSSGGSQTSAPAPAPTGASSSSGAASSSSSSAKGGRKKDPEQAVDPGVYWDGSG